MAKKKLITPGEIVESMLKDYQIPIAKAAEDLALSSSAVRQIVSGKTKISLQVALRLAKYFGQTSEYWVNLQNQYDLAEAKNDPKLAETIKNIPKAKKAKVPPSSAKKDAKPGKGRAPKASKTPEKSVKKPVEKVAKPRKAAK